MILITGGTGFLGSTLIRLHIHAGIDVVATKRPSSSIPLDLQAHKNIHWIDADLNNYFDLQEAFLGITQVYHCAAAISYQKKEAALLQKINVLGTANLVNICLAQQVRLVHVSSIAALGKNNQGLPVSETDKWEYERSISNYARSKYEGEMEVWRGIAEGLDAVIVNPSLIIGAQAPAHGTAAIFNKLQQGLSYYPSGSIGLVDVEDVAKIMMLLMANTSITAQRYIINNINISYGEFLQQAAAAMQAQVPQKIVSAKALLFIAKLAEVKAFFTNSKPDLTPETARAASSSLAYSNAKLVKLLGYQFKPLAQTLSEISSTLKHI
ncbi:NAD-dependent epimerase/dehydratase family protein [Sphingobacteriaceae bacterium WQ 2009]|uniref:NAD-dependent epimerase/dehydratase family protein n=1 Tax=Rhinopithecimicrobium faecis TaxID=2820698 RepID=A0A8T4HDK7_9SPHI|nr:NAD-dependent epimerase/dehydratase family protein [Sphingobacteriaceae bacterium WQ 2009]